MVITFNLSYAPVEALNCITVECERISDNINLTKSTSTYDTGYLKGSYIYRLIGFSILLNEIILQMYYYVLISLTICVQQNV